MQLGSGARSGMTAPARPITTESLGGLSKILGQMLEFVDGALRRRFTRDDAVAETVLDVILDQLSLGVRDRALHRMKLLCEFDAGSFGFDHGDHRCQMSLRPLQPLDDAGMGMVVLHPDNLARAGYTVHRHRPHR